ncbi:MAG TPA: hypothetical protein DCS29_03430 [Candidatus Magasanikbacteria bacterium]|nr:hypothetical protein [Candidatus Magasanikbacteria bacterium]
MPPPRLALLDDRTDFAFQNPRDRPPSHAIRGNRTPPRPEIFVDRLLGQDKYHPGVDLADRVGHPCHPLQDGVFVEPPRGRETVGLTDRGCGDPAGYVFCQSLCIVVPGWYDEHPVQMSFDVGDEVIQPMDGPHWVRGSLDEQSHTSSPKGQRTAKTVRV